MRALILNPDLIVCDEPVSALDVSVQSQIINLLQDLQQERGLTYLFISHDMSVIRYTSSRVDVMYLGHLVEEAATDDLFAMPLHPDTQVLLSANPHTKKQRIVLEGDLPSPINPPTGCVFHTRCPYAMGVCSQQCPAMREVMPGHRVACHLHGHPHEDQLDLRKEALILMGYMDLPRVSLINLPTPLEECRRLRATLLALLIALGIQLACWGLCKLLYRFAPEPRRKVLQYATLCSNAGFMGNPIVEGIYGAQGLLFALMLTQAPLPGVIERTLSYLSACTLPVSILIIGSILAGVRSGRVFDPLTLCFCAVRLLGIPLLCWLMAAL